MTENETLTVKLDESRKIESIKIKKGVRRSDTILSKLFTLALEDAFQSIEWEEKIIKIDGIYLHHLRFTDHVVMISENLEGLKIMIEQLNQASLKVEI